MVLTVTATGPASVQTVWNRYVTPEIWPQWAPHIRAVDYPQATLAPATQGQLRGPVGVRLGFRIDDVDEAQRCWSWTVAPRLPKGGARLQPRVRMDHGVTADVGGASGAGSRVWVRMHLPAPVAMLYAPLAWVALKRLVSPGVG